MAGENREGAVDLLGEYDAREFVGHSKRGERDFLLGGSAQVSREAFSIAAEEDEFARAAVAQIAEPFCELLRGELLARGVEQNDRRARVEFKFAQRSGASVTELGNFGVGVMADAGGVVVEERAGFFAARFAQHQEAEFHMLIAPSILR